MGSHHDLWQSGAAGASFDNGFYAAHGYAKAPLLVQWMATEQCSLRCAHCLVGDGDGGTMLTLSEVSRLVDQIADLGVQQLLITGGEPLQRPDIGEVVELLREREIRWSLNTARLPDSRARDAMAAYPPAFVAVSLDGPERHHDRHRGEPGAYRQALEAITWFRSVVTSGQVVAGTTITRQSVGLLEQTFGEVVKSGASGWGLHVVFPEGRAADRPELYLTRRQLRRLMRFAAEKRAHFPITLGDEFGYLGAWEPLLRGEPFFCGAGKTQCVVLADGEVVPCTTTDRAVSAGSVRHRSLGDIWTEGFTDLRRPRLTAQCRQCGFAEACGGGCWLQRRHGAHCYRDVWSRPRDLATAAGMAVCLGLASCAGSTAGPTRPSNPTDPRPVASRPAASRAAARPAAKKPARIGANDALEVLMMRWMRTRALGRRATVAPVKKQIKQLLGADPAGEYLQARLDSKSPATLSARLAAIRAALNTKQRSLSFAALLSRDLAEWCLVGTPAARRTAAQRKGLRTTLRALDKRTRQWRKEIFAQRLSPFLTREYGVARPFMLLKSLRVRISDPALAIVAAKRYQLSNLRHQQIAAAFLKRQPYARSMRLQFTVPSGKAPERVSNGKVTRLSGKAHLDVFDLLRVPAGGATLQLAVTGSTLSVSLPASSEVTWADVLRLAYEQHRKVLDGWAQGWNRQGINVALQLPALHAQRQKILASANPTRGLRQLDWKLLYAWMF